ncbi:MAG: FAD-dependent oxidoreductase [Gammaproteobacteria bacterium]|nr:FAD-dependent oxidoreductase [Gammaproteobacteria bacterium]
MPVAATGPASARQQSLWLEQALAGASSFCPPLHGERRADVAIIGGGYVGLWTAMELKQREPALDVIILEQDICGSGASGRNGGYVLSWWTKAPSMRMLWGDEIARELILKSETAIDDLDVFCRQENIDAEFTRSGWVWGGVSKAHAGSWSGAVQACRQLGVGDFQELDREAAAQLAGTDKFISAILDSTAAMLHPGKLVRGMRAAALRRGIAIYEHSRVNRFTRQNPVRLDTATGTVTAAAVVVATNAWAAAMPELSRSIVVVASDMIASRPVTDRLKRLDWLNRAGVNDSQQMVNYVRTTADGRVLAGKGGLASAYGGRISDRLFYAPGRARIVQKNFAELYPAFANVEIEHAWSGPVDRSADGLPMLGCLPGHENIVYGIGWSGNGVGPSRIGGRILASLVLREKNEWSSLPIVREQPGRDLPMEPVRYLGGHLVRAAVAMKDRAETRDRKPGFITQKIASLAPKGVEDR